MRGISGVEKGASNVFRTIVQRVGPDVFNRRTSVDQAIIERADCDKRFGCTSWRILSRNRSIGERRVGGVVAVASLVVDSADPGHELAGVVVRVRSHGNHRAAHRIEHNRRTCRRRKGSWRNGLANKHFSAVLLGSKEALLDSLFDHLLDFGVDREGDVGSCNRLRQPAGFRGNDPVSPIDGVLHNPRHTSQYALI